MKKYLVIIMLMLTGCAATKPPVVVAPEWPDAPGKQSLEPCGKLEKLPENAVELSDVATVVVDNYSAYYKCSVKVDAWIEWYNLQKEVYEGATK